MRDFVEFRFFEKFADRRVEIVLGRQQAAANLTLRTLAQGTEFVHRIELLVLARADAGIEKRTRAGELHAARRDADAGRDGAAGGVLGEHPINTTARQPEMRAEGREPAEPRGALRRRGLGQRLQHAFAAGAVDPVDDGVWRRCGGAAKGRRNNINNVRELRRIVGVGGDALDAEPLPDVAPARGVEERVDGGGRRALGAEV